jgi:hypothetical protein
VSTILAWHGDPELKAAALARMQAHREADDFIQGLYLVADIDGHPYKGCFHGCLTAEALAAERNVPIWTFEFEDTKWWAEGERLWGIPCEVGGLLDKAFETVDEDRAGDFAVASIEAIAVGADLAGIDYRKLYEEFEDADYDPAIILAALAAAPVPAMDGAA